MNPVLLTGIPILELTLLYEVALFWKYDKFQLSTN